MANMAKLSRKDLVPILREAYRDLKEGQYKNYVDLERSNQNYVIGCQNRKELVEKMDARCEEIMGGKINKQSKPLFTWVVHYPEDHPEIDLKAFFSSINDFMIKEYGKDNVMAVCVHMDETRPHAHCFIVPEAISRKNGERTVSVASLLQKPHLEAFHGKLDDFLYERFKMRNLVQKDENEKGKLENVPMLEHKKRMLKKENEKLESDNEGLETRYQEKRQAFMQDLIRLQNERNQLQKENEELQDENEELHNTVNSLKTKYNNLATTYNDLVAKVKGLRDKFRWWSKSSDDIEARRKSAMMKKEIENEFPDLW